MKKNEMELKKKLERKIQKILKGSGFRNIEIIFLSPDRMAELNRTYLGRNGPATIITFPYHSALPGEVEAEVYICMEEILSEAEKSETGLNDYFEKIAHHILHSIKKS